MLSAAQLLDELMGRDRNLAPDEKRCNVRWDDESVCKYYLCGFCPAELFTNTRSDLGPCEKIHDENLRKLYEKSSRFMKEGYERDFLRYLQSLLAEVERRIRRGHARLALSQAQQNSGTPGPSGKNEEKAQVLTEKIEELVVQIEELGSEGRVEEAQGMMKLVEQLKEEREELSSTHSTIESFAAQEKQMEVCEVCGAFLIVGDAQSRVDDHLMGKQHMGYAKIKSTVEELKEKLRRRSEDPEKEDQGKKVKDDREREREEREIGTETGIGREIGTGAAGGVTPTADTPAGRQTAAGAAPETGGGPGVKRESASAAGVVTVKGGAVGIDRTGSVALAAGTGGDPAALSARAIGTVAAAETEIGTEETETRTNPPRTKSTRTPRMRKGAAERAL
ncbi:luc7-like protein 3 isoform 2 [Danio rerio]|uniref:Luc7-like protein 3 isoform 2 n=1 Tax=Danio rerio TaxID=7955 RepID=Q1ED13_DANRE|nr:luc7-like protein 3 isoform 2 [Danio rerio]AAI17593.1 Zgc:136380 [Danio rerio]|eukprot:NP_001038784.1 luc7-like protein 3 isoform 2 [Danio rerio]